MKFGVDFYPEQWESWEADIPRLKELGIKTVRIMEFAWTIIEPQEGVFDFSFFDNVIDVLGQHSIDVVIGTPTATIPSWLANKDASLFQIWFDGSSKGFGSRSYSCFNSNTYNKYSNIITEKLAKHYGEHKNVIGWHIANEIGHEASDFCICANCKNSWPKWLEKKYKTIENLNNIWGNVFWGVTYNSFDEIPVYKKQHHLKQNPSLILDYYRFNSDSVIEYSNNQYNILRRNVSDKQWITTDLFSPSLSCNIDFEEMFKKLDCVGVNNYPVWGDMDEPIPYYFLSFLMSYQRGLKKEDHFKIFEQICGFQGHDVLGYRPPYKQINFWTNHAITHGCSDLFYFRWKTAKFGQEQLCHGIINADGKTTKLYNSLKENIKNNFTDFTRISNSQIIKEACILYDKDNILLLKDQYLTNGLLNKPNQFMSVGADAEITRYYAGLSLFNINVDVKSTKSVDLDNYKLIVLPLYQMADKDFVKKLEKWVLKGGTLVLGWRAGTKTVNNHTVEDEIPGLFQELVGITIEEYESLNNNSVKMKYGLIPIKGENWADIIKLKTAKPVARYSDKSKFYNKECSISINNYGKGNVYYFGTSPNQTGLFFLFKKIIKKSGLDSKFCGIGIESVKWKDELGQQYRVVLNHTNKTKRAFGKKIKGYDYKIVK